MITYLTIGLAWTILINLLAVVIISNNMVDLKELGFEVNFSKWVYASIGNILLWPISVIYVVGTVIVALAR